MSRPPSPVLNEKPGKRYVSYGMSQLIVQFAGVITGILIIRSIEKTEYAYYSITIGLLALLTYLLEAGPTSTLLRKLAPENLKKESRLSILNWAINQRVALSFWLSAAGVLYIVIALVSLDASNISVFAFSLLLFLNFIPIVPLGLLMVHFRSIGQIRNIQKSNLLSASIRLLATVTLAFLGINSPFLYLLVNLLSLLAQYIYLNRKSAHKILSNVRIRKPMRLDTNALGSTLPVAILVVAAEQIYTLLLSVFSSPAVVAEASALTKFGAAFVVVNAIYQDVVIPRIAKTTGRRNVGNQVLKWLSVYLVASLTLVIAVWIAAPVLLQLLGKQYGGLEQELVIFCSAISLAYLSQTFDQINKSRGWTKGSYVYFPTLVLWIFASFFLGDLNNLYNAAILFFLMPLPNLITQLLRFAYGFSKESDSRN